MKCTLTQIIILVSVFLTSATAMAAGGRYDNSGVFVWSFLALCALIALAQLLPSIGKAIQRALEIETGTEMKLGTSTTRKRAA